MCALLSEVAQKDTLKEIVPGGNSPRLSGYITKSIYVYVVKTVAIP